MGLSAYLNNNPKLTAGVVGAIIIVSLVTTVYSLYDGRSTTTRAFYTVDDGQTTFVDSTDRRPPFDRNGKPAVRAEMFSTDGGKTRFIGYLVRYTADALKKLQAADADRAAGKDNPLTAQSREIDLDGTEVKKPGEAAWVLPEDRAGRSRVMTVPSPDGNPVDAVLP